MFIITMKCCGVLVFVFLFNLVSAQDTETRRLCIQALYQAKESIDQIIEVDPYFKDKLRFGVVNEDSLSLKFEYLPKESNLHPGTSNAQGIKFAFMHPIDRPANSYARTFEWHYLDVHLLWHWSWPNIPFGSEHQEKIMQQLRQAVQPLSEYEREAVRRILSSQDEEGLIVEGDNKIELRLRMRPDTAIVLLDLYAIGINSDSIFLTNEVLYALIVDDSIHNLNIPNGFIMYLGHSIHTGPFVAVTKDDLVFIRSIPLPLLPPGSHTIRVITSFNTNSWVDYRPAILDGQPIHRTLEKAWVGRIFSDRIQVDINNKGLIINSAHPLPDD